MDTGPRGYIHIGPVKTGSTYIQKTFFQNAAVFERFGISYPFVSLPSVDLPRYTNAMFMWDRSRDDETKRVLQTFPKFLISEESIFFHPWTLRHPAIDGLQTRIVLYVRRPAELILSWVAECAEPYNAISQSLPDVRGPLSVTEGIEFLSRYYEESIWRFISFVAGARGTLDIAIRAFDRDSFVDNDLLADFLDCLGLDAKAVRADPEFRDPGVTNEAGSRKFCDISHTTWELLGRPKNMTTYNPALVEQIVSRYPGGDHRPIIETVGDDVIRNITQRFAFFENFLSDEFLGGARVFKNPYPSVYGKPREPYRPIVRRDIEALVNEAVSTRAREQPAHLPVYSRQAGSPVLELPVPHTTNKRRTVHATMTDRPVLYIHIGTVMTGSTHIQKTFYENSSVFEEFGVEYPYVFPPAVHLPRYANAQFLVDRSRDEDAQTALRESTFAKVLISEENIFLNIDQLTHPAFRGSSNHLILYVRRPAELILSWAAECAQPYNAFLQEFVSKVGPVSIEYGIEYLSDWYERSIRRFMDFVTELTACDVTVRPFEQASLRQNDVLADFLHCVGLDAQKVRSHPKFRDLGSTNETQSRKFCDISHSTWLMLGRPTVPFPYGFAFVEEVSAACESGDARPPIETVDDGMIEKISSRFAFFEDFLSNTFLEGAPLFKDRYPDIFGKAREPYRAIDPREVELLTDLSIVRGRSTKPG